MTSVGAGSSLGGDPPVTLKNESDDASGAQAQQRDTLSSEQQQNGNNIGKAGASKGPKFEGSIDKLNGYIYDCTYRQADTYTKTTKQIAVYVGRKYNFGGDVKLAIEKLQRPVLAIPADPSPTATESEKRIWLKRIDEFVKREAQLESNMTSAYSVVWGQCTDAIIAKLEARDNHEEISGSNDVLGLLKNIRDIAFNFQSQRYKTHSLHEAKRRFFKMSQEKGMTCAEYLERFKNQVEVIEHCGGSVVDVQMIEEELLGGVTLTTADRAQIGVAKLRAKEKYLACAFLLGADRTKYGRLIEDLENAYLQGEYKYPTKLDDAHGLLAYWKQDPRNLIQVIGTTSDGVAFINEGDEDKTTIKGKGKKDNSHITCFNCCEKGHYSNMCPHPKKTDKSSKLDGMVHAQTTYNEGYPEENITTSFAF
jgi:hypothetical protein